MALFGCITPRPAAWLLAMQIGSGVALGQCAEWHGPWGGLVAPFANRVVTSWRPPDAATGSPYLVVVGPGTIGGVPTNGIGGWNGREWTRFGEWSGTINSTAVWDPDGNGPQSPWLVVAGPFTHAAGDRSNGSAAWDGTRWIPLGSTAGYTRISSVATWDPDGQGPLGRELLCVGQLRQKTGYYAVSMGRWSDGEWVNIGPPISLGASFDPDGGGLLGEWIVTGNQRVWNGTTTVQLGPDIPSASVSSQTVLDFDGAGPLPSRLVICGTFTEIGGVPVPGVAQWNGQQWIPVPGDSSPVDRPMKLGSLDADGDGPGGATLVLAHVAVGPLGRDEIEILGLTAQGWARLASNLEETDGLNVSGLLSWDHDGDPDTAQRLLVHGAFRTSVENLVEDLAMWDGERWLGVGSGFNKPPSYIHTWDPDGTGPMPRWLITSGLPLSVGNEHLGRIAGFDGSEWHSLDHSAPPGVTRAFTWSEASYSDAGQTLGVMGNHDRFRAASMRFPLRWNGVEWSSIGGGVASGTSDASVWCVVPWDPDGDGATPDHLLVGGSFATAGAVLSNNIALWDGAEWHGFGAGLGSPTLDYVHTTCAWDPDGAGPDPVRIAAGGRFQLAPGQPIEPLALWNGVAWEKIESGGRAFRVNSLHPLDPDGDGPLPTWLVVAGDVFLESPPRTVLLAAWDGTSWLSFPLAGTPPTSSFNVFVTDPDGSGPEPRSLFGRRFADGQWQCVRYIGGEWSPYGAANPQASVISVAVWDRFDGDAEEPSIVLAGEFQSIGGAAIGGLAYTRAVNQLPEITVQPTSLRNVLVRSPLGSEFSDSVTCSVRVKHGATRFQWRLNGAPLGTSDEHGNCFSGSQTPDLRICAPWANEGVYDCVIENECGATVSEPSVLSGWYADYYPDSCVTIQDFTQLMHRFRFSEPSADLNRSGRIDSQDIFDFLADYFAE